MSRAPQLAVRLLLSLGWLVLTLFGAVLFGLVNFLVSWQAFEIIGFEDFQLTEVPLIGPIAVALGVGTAPLAAAFALGLILIMGLLVGATVKVAWELMTLAVDRHRVGAAGDRELAAQYTHEILLLSLRLVALGVFAVLAVRMDVALFEIRTRVLLTDAHDISDFLGIVPDSVAQLGAYLAAFADKFVWGYMACVIGTALIVEHAFGRAAIRWQGLVATLAQAIEGHSEARRAGSGEVTPTILPVGHTPQASNSVTMSPAEPVKAPSLAPDPVSAPAAVSPTTPVPVPRAGSGDVEVIVGPGELRRLALEEVEQNPERFVRDSSGRQWFARHYYESVMGHPEPVQEEQR